MKSTKDILTELGACAEAVKWAGRKTPKKAWETCKRGDWLLWIADKLNVGRKLLVLAACACARTALKYVPAGEERPRLAIEAAERWADNPTEKNKVAAAAAWAAARAAAWTAGDAGAAAAARAAAGAAAAARAAAGAAAAARAAAGAAAAARAAAWTAGDAGAAAWAAAHKDMAKIVRKIIPFSVICKAIAEYEGKK